MKEITPKDISSANKVQAVLNSIANGKPIFFNVTQYEKMGLIESRKKWTMSSSGKKIHSGYSFHLTYKAKQFLNIQL